MRSFLQSHLFLRKEGRCKILLFFLAITILVLATIPSVSAGVPGSCSPAGGQNLIDSGYVSENYTLELIGNDQVKGINTENMSGDIIRKFYAGYGSNLTSRWAGFAKNDSAPMSAYVFRVSTGWLNHQLYRLWNGSCRDVLERVRHWEDTILANETTRSHYFRDCQSLDTVLPVTEQGSTRSASLTPAVSGLSEPYGQTTVSQEMF